MSTVTGRAEIEARLTNLEGVLAGLRQVGKTTEEVATKGTKVSSAFQSAGGVLSGLARSAITVAGVFQAIDLSRATDQFKQLDMTATRFAQASGQGLTDLKSKFAAIEAKTLTSAPALANMAQQLGRATYDGKAAAGAMEDLADYAQATGQQLSDMGGSFLSLNQGLGVTQRFGDELGRIRDIAAQVGTKGGHVALVDTLTALNPQLAQVNTETDQARAKLEALVGVLGKGLKPQQAQQVAGGVLSMLKEKAFDIERATGKQVIDRRTGQLIDPTQTLRELQALRARQGGSQQVKEARAVNTYGWDIGMALMRTDFSQVDKIAAASTKQKGLQAGATAEEAARFRQTEAAKREAERLALEQKNRDLGGGTITSFQDWIHGALGPTGMFAASTAATVGGAVGGTIGMQKLAAGARSLFSLGASGAETGAGAAAAEGAGAGASSSALGNLGAFLMSGAGLMSGAFLGAGAMQVKTLSEIGEDRDTMGARWRAEHASVQGRELAAQAMRAGDLAGVIGKAGGDKETIVAMLQVLESRFAQLDETLRTQVAAGIAAELHRAPIVVRTPQDPNKPTASGAN